MSNPSPKFTPAFDASMSAIDIAAQILGGRKGVAATLGLSLAAVQAWRQRGRPVPMEYVPLLVNACNDPRVTCMSVRPDYAAHWLLLAELLNKQPVEELAA